MKVKVETIKRFTPFKLEIEIETKEELFYLWHIINNGLDTSICSDKVPVPSMPVTRGYELWKILDKKVCEINEKTA